MNNQIFEIKARKEEAENLINVLHTERLEYYTEYLPLIESNHDISYLLKRLAEIQKEADGMRSNWYKSAENHQQKCNDIAELERKLTKMEAEVERLSEINNALENDLINANMNLEHMTELVGAQRWVPVSERLPDYDVPVLVTYIGYLDGKIYSDGVAKWDLSANGYNGGWIWTLDDGDVEVTVTHWLPLPELPEEGVEHDGKPQPYKDYSFGSNWAYAGISVERGRENE